MIKYGLFSLLLILCAPASLAVSDVFSPPIFEGKYHCEGMDPYINKAYSGTVIVTHNNSVYKLEMNYDTGERSLGTGGQYDASLMSVVFQDKKI